MAETTTRLGEVLPFSLCRWFRKTKGSPRVYVVHPAFPWVMVQLQGKNPPARQDMVPLYYSSRGTEPLSRFSTTEHSEHTEKNPSTARSCFRVFGVCRG
jgi:hypothetical protein